MALDLHLAKNEAEALYVSPSASFEMKPHELIFDRPGLPDGKFPLFRRMENYHEDAKYGPEELTLLINEVRELEVLFSKNQQLVAQLESILAACQTAFGQKLGIWVYCD